MTLPPWSEWFQFEDKAVIVGGKRLPAIFYHGLLKPTTDELWGVAYVPIESGLYVSFYADRDPTFTEHVTLQVVEFTENEVLDIGEWDLCPHEDGDPRHFRRCRVGPHGKNYLAVDLIPSRAITVQQCSSSEAVFDYLHWASSLYVDGVTPNAKAQSK